MIVGVIALDVTQNSKFELQIILQQIYSLAKFSYKPTPPEDTQFAQGQNANSDVACYFRLMVNFEDKHRPGVNGISLRRLIIIHSHRKGSKPCSAQALQSSAAETMRHCTGEQSVCFNPQIAIQR